MVISRVSSEVVHSQSISNEVDVLFRHGEGFRVLMSGESCAHSDAVGARIEILALIILSQEKTSIQSRAISFPLFGVITKFFVL